MTAPVDPHLLTLLERATADAMAREARTSELFWETLAEAAADLPTDELLGVGVTFCGSDEPAMRTTGAGLLAELCSPPHEAVDEALAVLGPLLAHEREPDVIRVALHGIAQTGRAAGVAIAAPFAGHADPGVRLDATHALYSCAGSPPRRDAIDALIALTRDADEEVRDWATFGLGTSIDVDDPAVRDALAARLDDAYLDAREEAAVGLARRRDPRALEPVRLLLDEEEVSSLTVEAAGHLGDERFLRPLLELGEWWEDDSDLLRLAIARCDPSARARLDARVRETTERIRDGIESSRPGSRLDAVRTRPAFADLGTDLVVQWTDVAGLPHEAVWSLERLFGRSDVADDPARAAEVVMGEMPG